MFSPEWILVGYKIGRPLMRVGVLRSACAVLLAAAGALVWPAPPASAAEVVQPTLVQTIETSRFSPSSPDPAGIVYMPGQDRFLISDSEVDEMPLYAGKNLFTATRSGSGFGVGTTLAVGGRLRISKEATGLGLNPDDRTLFVSDDDADKISVVKPGTDGVHGTADDIFTQFSTATFGSGDAEGVEYDTATGHVFVCDGADLEVYRIDPVNALFGDGNDVVTSFDLAQYGVRDCDGLGLDSQRSTLLAVDPSTRKIYELSKSGGLIRTLHMPRTVIPIATARFASVTMAPSSDPLDSPTAMNYWVVDRNVDNGKDPNENDGLLYELAAAQPPVDPPPARTVSVSSPTAGSTVFGTVSVSASVSDNDSVESVQFLVDGAAIGADTNGADGWSVSWNTAPVVRGSHSITAIVTDRAGNGTTSVPVQVTVADPPAAEPPMLSIPVARSADDADELRDGAVRTTTGDIELGTGSEGISTTAGLRFTGVQVPAGANILYADVQFQVDETKQTAANFVIRAQQADNPTTFLGSTAFNVSSRPLTSQSVAWAPPAWSLLGAAGPDQRTPDLKSVIQEIVNRPGWSSGNALSIIITGSGRRTAESFDGGAPPPILHVRYATP